MCSTALLQATLWTINNPKLLVDTDGFAPNAASKTIVKLITATLLLIAAVPVRIGYRESLRSCTACGARLVVRNLLRSKHLRTHSSCCVCFCTVPAFIYSTRSAYTACRR